MNVEASVDLPRERVGAHAASAPWRLILRKELHDLWLGGRLLPLLILFTLLMSITSILREMESGVNLIPPSEMVFLTVLSTISFGMLLGLVIGADTISGERERATLEPLLLSPASGRQIVFGKFLAALSPWPAAFLLSIPYVVALAKGDGILGLALVWTALLGSLLAVAFTGFAMLVSMWSRSNRTSLFVSLFVYLLFLIPTQFPGQAQKGALGYTVQQLNPLQASSEFLEKLIVNNRAPGERSSYLVALILSAVVVVGLLFLYAAPRLRFEGGTPRLKRTRRRSAKLAAMLLVAGLVGLGTVLAPPAVSQATSTRPSHAGLAAGPVFVEAPALDISIDMEYADLKTGDEIDFNTEVRNSGATASPKLVVAMSIIKLGNGDPVDPEDWSPERTQVIDALDPDEVSDLSWTVEAILDGDYMVFMTVVAKPGASNTTSVPISSPGIHLTVAPFQSTNPGGIMPIALGIPIAMIVITVVLRRYWRRDGARAIEPSQAAS